jgi:hypothetical protein
MPTLKAGPGPTNLNPDDGPDQRELEDFTEPDRWNDPDDEPELDFAAGPRAAELLGFWSYVHKDDDVDMGRVTQLARDIVANYEAIKAEEIRLFLDRDDLHWGDRWRDQVDDALSNVAFFVPVITPRYFMRPECRREFQYFLQKARSLGIIELILPILYIDVPGLHEEEPSDELMRALKDIQWESWLDFRFTDRQAAEYRRAVDRLARELVRRVDAVEHVDIATAAQKAEISVSSEESEDGTLDKLATLEEAMPRWADTLDSIGREIEAIGSLMDRGTADIEQGEKQGKGFAARLHVARRVAGDLEEPVAKIERLAQDFVADLNHIDMGVRTILAQAENETSDDPDALATYCEFLDSIRFLSASAHDGLGSVEGMIAASGSIEKLSKDMRAPVRRLRTSLVAMVEAREITDSWVDLIEGVDIDCSQVEQRDLAADVGFTDTIE